MLFLLRELAARGELGSPVSRISITTSAAPTPMPTRRSAASLRRVSRLPAFVGDADVPVRGET